MSTAKDCQESERPQPRMVRNLNVHSQGLSGILLVPGGEPGDCYSPPLLLGCLLLVEMTCRAEANDTVAVGHSVAEARG